MPNLFRVKDKTTGHEYTTALVEEHHTVLKDKPAVDDVGQPLPPKMLRQLDTGTGGYGEQKNADLEAEIARRNGERDPESQIQPATTKKDDLVAALEADDQKES